MKFLFILLLLLQNTFCQADQNESHWYRFNEARKVELTVDLFLSSTCPHCKHANEFFNDVQKQHPWLIVNRFFIDKDREDLKQFYTFLKKEHSDYFDVPAIYFCESHWIGFDTAKTTGQILLQKLNYCRQKIQKEKTLSQTTQRMLQQEAKANQLLSAERVLPSKISTIPLVALMDSFAVCNFFCFTAFLAFLWMLPWRPNATEWKIGLIWIAVIGVMHFIQQEYGDLYMKPLPGLMIYTLLIGAGLLAYCVPNRFKSMRLLTILGGLVLAIIYYYQQRCPYNIAFVFEQWLQSQSYLKGFYPVCIFVYQLFYVSPLLMFLCAWNLIRRYRFIKRERKQYPLFARIFLCFMAGLLIVYPAGFMDVPLYFAALLIAMILTSMIGRRQNSKQ